MIRFVGPNFFLFLFLPKKNTLYLFVLMMASDSSALRGVLVWTAQGTPIMNWWYRGNRRLVGGQQSTAENPSSEGGNSPPGPPLLYISSSAELRELIFGADDNNGLSSDGAQQRRTESGDIHLSVHKIGNLFCALRNLQHTPGKTQQPAELALKVRLTMASETTATTETTAADSFSFQSTNKTLPAFASILYGNEFTACVLDIYVGTAPTPPRGVGLEGKSNRTLLVYLVAQLLLASDADKETEPGPLSKVLKSLEDLERAARSESEYDTKRIMSDVEEHEATSLFYCTPPSREEFVAAGLREKLDRRVDYVHSLSPPSVPAPFDDQSRSTTARAAPAIGESSASFEYHILHGWRSPVEGSGGIDHNGEGDADDEGADVTVAIECRAPDRRRASHDGKGAVHGGEDDGGQSHRTGPGPLPSLLREVLLETMAAEASDQRTTVSNTANFVSSKSSKTQPLLWATRVVDAKGYQYTVPWSAVPITANSTGHKSIGSTEGTLAGGSPSAVGREGEGTGSILIPNWFVFVAIPLFRKDGKVDGDADTAAEWGTTTDGGAPPLLSNSFSTDHLPLLTVYTEQHTADSLHQLCSSARVKVEALSSALADLHVLS